MIIERANTYFSLISDITTHTSENRNSIIKCVKSVADLGFPPGRGANSPGGGANSPGGAPTYDFAKFSQKLHEFETIWTPGGGALVQNFTM